MSKLSAYDKAFLEIMQGMTNLVQTQARQSAEYILEISKTFLDEKAKNSLLEFKSMYFGNGGQVHNLSDATNKEVDQLFDSLQASVASGAKDIDVHETDTQKQQRLTLSGLQKRLEMIISLDDGIKEKLLPVLSSMQFEDMIQQRLSHIHKLWQVLLEDNPMAVEMLSDLPTSIKEREQFYRLVLGTEVPEEKKQDSRNILDFLF